MNTTRSRQRTLVAATAAVVLVSGFAPADPPDVAVAQPGHDVEPATSDSSPVDDGQQPGLAGEPPAEPDAPDTDGRDSDTEPDTDPDDAGDTGSEPDTDDAGDTDLPDSPDADDPATEPGTVVIVLPDLTPAGEQSWFVPRIDGIAWTVNTHPIHTLTQATDLGWLVDAATLGHAVVVATALDGHLIATGDGQQTTTSQVVLDTRQPVELTEPAPASGGRFVVPDVPGLVMRDHAGALLVPGEHSAADHGEIAGDQVTVTLTVEAAGGYRLENQGVPVEAQPGAGGVWTTVLTIAVEPPADDEPEPAPSMGAPAPRDREAPDQPAETPAAEDDEPERATFVPPAIAASLDPLTHRTGEREPEADTGDETGEVVEEAEELSQTGPQRLDIISLLGVSSLLAAWVMVRARRDELM